MTVDTAVSANPDRRTHASSPRRGLRRLARDRRVRFLLVGAWNTVFGLSLFAALCTALRDRVHVQVINLIATEIAILVAFVAYQRFVFSDTTRGTASALVRFHGGYALSLTISAVLLWALAQRAGYDARFVQCLSVVVTTAISWVVHSRFSFADRGRP